MAHEGSAKDVRKLLDDGADVNFRNSSKWTPLHRAAAKGRADVDRSLRTPLHYAAAYGNEAATRALLAAGASRTSRDDEGWTPLDVARADFIRRLLII